MAKFNFKKWLTEHKHGKANINYVHLNEQRRESEEYKRLYSTLSQQIGSPDRNRDFFSQFDSMDRESGINAIMDWYMSTVYRMKQLSPDGLKRVPEPNEFRAQISSLKSAEGNKGCLCDDGVTYNPECCKMGPPPDKIPLQEGWLIPVLIGALVGIGWALWKLIDRPPAPCPCPDSSYIPFSVACCDDEGSAYGGDNMGSGDPNKPNILPRR